MGKIVTIISRNRYPNGDAGAVRDIALAKIYKLLGYDVFCIGLGREKKEGQYDGIPFYNIYIEESNLIEKVKSVVGFKKRMKCVIKKIEEQYGMISIMHIVDIPANAISFIKKYTATSKCQLIHDSVEWYSPCQFRSGKLSSGYLQKELLNRVIIDEKFKVIAISNYLNKHFSTKNIETVRIPVVMDSRSIEYETARKNEIVQIIYAGSPAKKDNISDIILSLMELSKQERERMHLHILGISEKQFFNTFKLERNIMNDLYSCLTFYGRVSREQVLALQKDMDFSILLRPKGERYSKAGFPTKVVESMMSGTAMICNITSDLDLYLEDMKNSIIATDSLIKSISNAIRKAILLNNTEIVNLKKNARKTAEENFDYRLYAAIIQELLG